MGRCYRPTTSVLEWRDLLADPEKHWREGHSAHALATSWEAANGAFPVEVQRALESAADSRLHGLEMIAGLIEHQTPLPGGSRPSQTDLLVLARNEKALVVVGVEGKAKEAFGPQISEWEGNPKRLEAMQALLPSSPLFDGQIRYQLVHRCAAAVLEAERFHAPLAVMLVHQFGGATPAWDDFVSFVRAMGQTARKGGIVSLGRCSNKVELAVGWVEE